MFSVVLNLTINSFDANSQNGSWLELFFYKTTLDNKQFESSVVSSFHVFMLFVYTFLTINTV